MNDDRDPDPDLEAPQNGSDDVAAGSEVEAAANREAATPIDEALAEVGAGDTARARALTDAEAGRIASTRRTTVVVLAGEVGTGKTTLLAALYERFGRGPVAGRSFAGSTTLPGFEARCWSLRSTSGRSIPAMPHTHRESLPWLHLRVGAPSMPMQELLLGDFDGEVFGDIIDGKEAATAVPALRRADHLAIVLDGGALADAERSRASEQRSTDLVTVLGSQRHAIADTRVVSLLVTKQDAVIRAPQTAQREVQLAIERVRRATEQAFDGYVPAVVTTAAVSHIEELPLGHGLDELIDLWNREPLVQVVPVAQATAAPPPGDWLSRFEA